MSGRQSLHPQCADCPQPRLVLGRLLYSASQGSQSPCVEIQIFWEAQGLRVDGGNEQGRQEGAVCRLCCSIDSRECSFPIAPLILVLCVAQDFSMFCIMDRVSDAV